MANVAVAYRLLGVNRLAYRWVEKATDLGDGNALAEIGCCYYLGVGVGRNITFAEQAFRSAICSQSINEYSRKEAMYFLSAL